MADARDAAPQALYDEIPAIECKGLCHDSKTETVRLIHLQNGMGAKVDVEDYERVMKYSWSATLRHKRWYAQSTWHDGPKGARHSKKGHAYLHRVVTDAPRGVLIDHRNGDGLDCRKENLRSCTHKQNCQNQTGVDGTSRYKGVSLSRARLAKPWQSHIGIDYKSEFLGRFATESEAAAAYDAAAVRLFGEFAFLNFPNGAPPSGPAPMPLLRTNGPRPGSTSRYKGVAWDKRTGRWTCSIHHDGRSRWLGRFTVEEDAAFAFDAESLRLLGEGCYLNFPDRSLARWRNG